uniref:Uncharacterized protein n=1 Tax=Glossina austeni TaxID=7395 RepID=A0A1A9UT21_GLOAU
MRSINFGVKNSFQGEYKFPIGEHKLMMAAFKVRFKNWQQWHRKKCIDRVGNCYLRSNCPHINLKRTFWITTENNSSLPLGLIYCDDSTLENKCAGGLSVQVLLLKVR